MDPLASSYQQNKNYTPQHDGTFWILSDADGWGLACDEAVYQIWQAFDGRPTVEVISSIQNLKSKIQNPFIETTIKVLARAGMLIPAEPLPPLARPKEKTPTTGGRVSIIILASRQAWGHLQTCIPSILAQTYTNLEIILVDNQTSDNSAQLTAQHFPQVKIISTPRPLGFSAANNLAMKQAQGEFFFLVNEDTEMEPDCIAQCVKVMARSARIAVVAPKMKLFYMRSFFNSMGGTLHTDGHFHDNFIGYLDVGQFDQTDQVIAACFGAVLLRRQVVEQIGYMDEAYFVYYADTDWSYLARLWGYDIVAAPQAVVYHKFNATVNTMASTFKLGLIVDSRLRFIWKNLNLSRAINLTLVYLELDRRATEKAKAENLTEVVKTYRQGWQNWVKSWPSLAVARWRTRRKRLPPFSDDELLALAAHIPPPMMYGRYPVIFTPTIHQHYMQVEQFKPNTTAAPVAAPAPTPSLWQKAQHVFNEKGTGQLMKETWQYLHWRLLIK